MYLPVLEFFPNRWISIYDWERAWARFLTVSTYEHIFKFCNSDIINDTAVSTYVVLFCEI